MKISYKLFFAFIGLTSIVLIATLSLARWSFDQGFLNYINAVEQERLTFISEELSNLYQEHQQRWDNISQIQFDYILYPNFARDKRFQPNPLLRGAHPPPRHDRFNQPLRPDERVKPPRPKAPPTGLYSIDNTLISGADIADLDKATFYPVIFKEKIVAKLYSAPIHKVNTDSAQAFVTQQLYTGLWIGFLSLVLATIISYILARLLLVPVEKVVKGISFLSRGNYSERFDTIRQDELGQLMNDIDHLAVTLDKNRSAKNRWFADISHELRTPLSVLCGEIDAIKAGIRPFDNPQLLSLEQEVNRIKHLVDDLYQLSLSDLGGLKYNFQPINVAAVIDESLISLSGKFAEKELTIVFDSSVQVFINADKMRLMQLFSNVLLNAIAYTDGPGRIVVDIICGDTTACILFNDTKPSVVEEDCELLFEPLFRLDSSRTRRANGAGLGLTICRNIVEAHAGTITARPSNFGGLCIEIIFPLLQGRTT